MEPASAASVAGILKLAKGSYFKEAGKIKIVCVLTGHGLKDPDRAIASVEKPKVLKPKIELVLKEIGL